MLDAPLRTGLMVTALLTAARVGLAQSCLCGTAADELVAARVGLVREWVVQVPFDSAAWRLEHVVAGDSLVVAQGGDGTVAAIVTTAVPGQPRPGTVAWSTTIGHAPAPVEQVGIGGQSVAVARGAAATLLDAGTGRVLWERPLRTVASAAALPSGGWVYAPLDGGGMTRFPEDPTAEPPPPPEPAASDEAAPGDADVETAADGPRPGERLDPVNLETLGEIDFPPSSYAGGVLWCTVDGRITALVQTKQSSKRIEFDLGGPASGPPVVHAGDVFVATRAGDVARLARSPLGLTANAGVMKGADDQEVAFTGWHTIVDAVPEGSPLVSAQAVVISLGPSGLAAFATATGEPLWQVPAAGRPLAIIGDVVWCHEDTGFLVARDLATGGRRGRLCLGCFTLPVVNTVSERLILASPGGLVVSLAPRRTSATPAPATVAPATVAPARGSPDPDGRLP